MWQRMKVTTSGGFSKRYGTLCHLHQQRDRDRRDTPPGGLGVSRKAHSFHRKAQLFSQQLSQNGTLASYAYAVAEENASGGLIVTAPTCGACGVLPAVIRYLEKTMELTKLEVLRALATAG